MLTLFAMPKPFRGHIATIQRNAIQSWTHLRSSPEVILLGDDEGTAEVAREFGVRHLPNVARNGFGTPLLNDLFAKAQETATHDILCYVNADIILMDDFISAAERVSRRWQWFLMVGQRWDVDLPKPLDFGPGWAARLRSHVTAHGRLQAANNIDYFLFPRGLWGEMPPFALGRVVWDNWLLYRARARGAEMIDVSRAVMPVHQQHDYAHIPNGAEGAWHGPEARRNLELAGGWGHVYSLQDATWLLIGPIPMPAVSPWHVVRRLDLWLTSHPDLRAGFRPLKRLVMSIRRIPRSVEDGTPTS